MSPQLRNKIRCAVERLERGASLKEVADSCGLSLEEAYMVEYEYRFYVEVRNYFEERIRAFEDRVRKFEEKSEELLKKLELLSHSEENLRRRAEILIKMLRITCVRFSSGQTEAGGGVEVLKRIIGGGIDRFLESLRTVADPEIIRDLVELRRLVELLDVSEDEKRRLKERIEKVSAALTYLAMLAALIGDDVFTRLAITLNFLDICETVKKWEGGGG